MSTSKDPALVAAQLLESADHDDSDVLFESEDFSDDDSAFDLDSELQSTTGVFDDVVGKLTGVYGKPAFTGAHTDDNYPSWGRSGYRLAYWNVAQRILYVHITHADPEVPLELTLGVVDGPPEGWFIGYNPFDAG